MEVKVGYITRWRRAIFFSLVMSIVVFGVVSTIGKTLLGAGLACNVVSVAALLLCIVWMLLVVSDYFHRYEGVAVANIQNGKLHYEAGRKKLDIELSAITKLDVQPILSGQTSRTPLAYRVLIQTGRKKYYIESERAQGRTYSQVDVYRLYQWMQINTTKTGHTIN